MILAFCTEGAALEATWLVIARCERGENLSQRFSSPLYQLCKPLAVSELKVS